VGWIKAGRIGGGKSTKIQKVEGADGNTPPGNPGEYAGAINPQDAKPGSNRNQQKGRKSRAGRARGIS